MDTIGDRKIIQATRGTKLAAMQILSSRDVPFSASPQGHQKDHAFLAILKVVEYVLSLAERNRAIYAKE